MDKGDLATWVSAGIALVFSAAALIVSIRALRWQREGAKIAKQAQAFVEERYAEHQAKAEIEARRVKWEAERRGKSLVVLRNITDNSVQGLTIDPEQFGGIARNLPNGVDVAPYGSVEFMVAESWQTRAPREFWVTWVGGEATISLPP